MSPNYLKDPALTDFLYRWQRMSHFLLVLKLGEGVVLGGLCMLEGAYEGPMHILTAVLYAEQSSFSVGRQAGPSIFRHWTPRLR
jgi:hypothetical protein